MARCAAVQSREEPMRINVMEWLRLLRFRLGRLGGAEWALLCGPLVMLLAYQLGAEAALVLLGLGMPMVFAALALVRPPAQGDSPRPGAGHDPARRDIVPVLDRMLRDGTDSGRSTACLVLLFDNPASLPDRHGRTVEAEVMRRCVDRMAGVLREGDLVARLDGGGFAVALAPVRRLDLETMIQLSARLLTALSDPVSIEARRIYVSVSVGFCLAARVPAAGGGAALLDAAQVAAEEALRHGPGAIRGYSPDMARHRADRDVLREQLEAALDNGQIVAFFQPQISADTGEITGFETLARWQHPDRGLVAPDAFIPAVAEAGLSERLSEVMLYQALAAMARWDRAGLGVPSVGVNFSADELRNPRLAEKLKWELDRFDLTPERLSVEILETVVAQTDSDVVVHNIAALARMGCGIDLDDFGTGHTSIANLRRFAVRRLKIDRSFVTRVDEDREQQRIVAAILSMAERLGLETLAEGVETKGELAMLAQLGCGHLQGFCIARPMPFDETPGWIAGHRAQIARAPRIGQRSR